MMNRSFLRKFQLALLLALVFVLGLSGCSANLSERSETTGKIPEIPDKLERNDDQVPVLAVYNTEKSQVEEMDVESYIMGVVAGEMKNTWPIEALKAQAILARTFTMKFVSSKESSYENANISTDVQEAQAYDASAINEQIREAVNDTRGQVMIADGEFPYAWFHAHSGGMTELPSKALEYNTDPTYLSIVKSTEAEDAPEEVKAWTTEFSLDEVEKACADAGIQTGKISSFQIGEKGESGRAVTFLVNGQEVSAPSFRLQIGADRLKSTLIESIELNGDTIRFSGAGFGHGVGMSQWGAYQLAKDGKTAEEIVHHYFTGVELTKLW